ncbi:MAG: choline dehydrogenase, partial [Paracoccaceae bacterium]
DTYLKATAQAGLKATDDYNGADFEGAAIYQITTHKGVRASTARCYLRPALKRKNLRLILHAHVTGLVIRGKHAKGVTYRHKGKEHTAFAGREVILSAGAVNSPQLLQLSGIGAASHLKAHGIDVVADAPHVGQNLQDHLGTDLYFRANVPTLNQVLRPWLGRLMVGAQYVFRRNGPLSLSINQGGGFIRTDPDLAEPNLQLYFSPVSYTRAPTGKRPMMSPDKFPGFLLGASTCRPTSTGTIQIRSADPFDAPLIQPNYLSTEYDRTEMIAAVKFLRRLSETAAFKAVTEQEILPGPAVQSDAEIATYARDNAWTVFHPSGTCKMGETAASAVVDPRLRVFGIAGLRVVDASVFPNVTSGNINAPSIMVGERASEIILEDANL